MSESLTSTPHLPKSAAKERAINASEAFLMLPWWASNRQGYGQGRVMRMRPSSEVLRPFESHHCPCESCRHNHVLQIGRRRAARLKKGRHAHSGEELRPGEGGRHPWAASWPVSRSAEWPGQLQQWLPQLDGSENQGETDEPSAVAAAWQACCG